MNKNKKSKKRPVKIFSLVIAVLALFGAAYYTTCIKPNQEIQEYAYEEQTAQKGILQSTVTESGTVAFGLTTQVYDLDLSTEDEEDDDEEEDEEDYLKVEEVYVAVGQRIAQGDPIYKFSEDSIEDVRKALTYAKTEAQIALAEAQTEYSIGTLTAGLSYDETILAYELAQLDYDNTIAVLSNEMAKKSLQIEQLLTQIYELQLSLVEDSYREQKASVLETYEKAVAAIEDASESFVTQRVEAASTFKAAKESYESFFEQLEESNSEIDDTIQQIYELQLDIINNQQLVEKELLAASQSLESATVSGSIADTKYQSDLTTYETSLKNAQSDLEEAAEKLQAFEEFVGDGIVYAQGDGLITQLGYGVDDYLVSSSVLISFAGGNDMTISVDVSQEDVVTMKVADKVSIVFTAYEDVAYEGIVESITTTATSRSSATISYPVVVAIQGDTTLLYEGMTADVTFIIEQSQEVVNVPRKAIITENGQAYLYKKEEEEYVLSPVTTGFTDGSNIEIVSGLEEGENYYIQSIVVNGSEQDSVEENTGGTTDTPNGVNEMKSFPNMEEGSIPEGMENMPQQMRGGDDSEAR